MGWHLILHDLQLVTALLASPTCRLTVGNPAVDLAAILLGQGLVLVRVAGVGDGSAWLPLQLWLCLDSQWLSEVFLVTQTAKLCKHLLAGPSTEVPSRWSGWCRAQVFCKGRTRFVAAA